MVLRVDRWKMGVSRRLADACVFDCSTHLTVGVVAEKVQAGDSVLIILGSEIMSEAEGAMVSRYAQSRC